MTADTIAALATPAGRGALGIVRVSGPDVPHIAAQILGSLPSPRHAVRRAFRDSAGGVLDEGIAVYFPAPASYTGEAVLELQGHGGEWVTAAVLERVLALGARRARPGEFSERSFLNGKLDLAQAEAVADLIDAASDAAARAALRSLQGEFSERIGWLQERLTALRTQVEGAIDFPEEDVDFAANPALQASTARIEAAFVALQAAARQGVLLRDGLTVVVAGAPNAGKSSLFNRLAGESLAIVTDRAGTTRDILRAHLRIDGLPVTLVDTAGLREAADPAEQEGVRRARTAMLHADRILFVIDAGAAPSTQDQELASRGAAAAGVVAVTYVLNKTDLAGLAPGSELRNGATWLRVSARTGAGMELLTEHLKSGVGYLGPEAGALSARRRHLAALDRAHTAFAAAQALLGDGGGVELFAEELRHSQRSLSEITGEVTSEDLLGKIFSEFCIGK